MNNIIKLNSDIKNNKVNMMKSRMHHEESNSKLSKADQLEIPKSKFAIEQKNREIEILKKIDKERDWLKKSKFIHKSKTNVIQENDIQKFASNKNEDTNYNKNASSNLLVNEINENQESMLTSILNFNQDFNDLLINEQSEQIVTNLKSISPYETDEEDLAKPEFEGLWAIKTNIKMPPISENQKNVKNTKSLGFNAIDLKLKSFLSKPSKLEFINFNVGEIYCKKLSLTNITSAPNYCKLEGVSPQLIDYIQIEYQQKSILSAGIKCLVEIIFTPKEDVDLDGEIYFSSQCGPFSIPVLCRKKKIQILVDSYNVNFGQLVFGSAATKYITLKNTGALPAKFKFTKISYTEESNMKNNNNHSNEKENISLDYNINNDQETDNDNNLHDKKDVKSCDYPDIDCNDSCVIPDFNDKSKNKKINYDKLFIFCNVNELFDDFQVGEILSDHIPPFSSIKLPIAWKPKVIGLSYGHFRIYIYDDVIQDIDIKTYGEAIESPITLSRSNIDFKICILDKRVQESISIFNSGNHNYICTYELCKELTEHLQIIPKYFEIKPGQSITSTLKFCPRFSLLSNAPHCFDSDVNILDTNIFLHIQNQGLPLSFSLQACITNSNVSLSAQCINFDSCSIYESVARYVTIVNHSILAQKFAFNNVPPNIEILPNNGCGILLPNQTLELTIIYKPINEDNLCVNLICKTEYDMEVVLKCLGAAFRPPIFVNKSPIFNFSATAIGDSSTINFQLCQSNNKSNVCTWLYEFRVPECMPITFLPYAGQIKCGEKVNIWATYSPQLDDIDIRTEALRLMLKKMPKDRKDESVELTEEAINIIDMNAKKSARKLSASKMSDNEFEKGSTPLNSSPVFLNSKDYLAAKNNLLRRYATTFNVYRINCCIARLNENNTIQQFPEYTIVIEFRCTALKPEIVVVSGNQKMDFGPVLIGERKICFITVQNISDSPVALKSSCLDDTFEMVNALRCIQPNSFHNICIAFYPEKPVKYRESFNIIGTSTILHATLIGSGVEGLVSTNIESETINLGKIVVGDSQTVNFQITNYFNYEIEFNIIKVEYVNSEENKVNVNKNGLSVFEIRPLNDKIQPGTYKEISVTFNADRPGNFVNFYMININNNKESTLKFSLCGQSYLNAMYLNVVGSTYDPLLYSFSQGPELDEPCETVILYLNIHESKVLRLSCFKGAPSNQTSKSGKTVTRTSGNYEWSFENALELERLGFYIDSIKGNADPGNEKDIIITWNPTDDYLINNSAKAMANCILKGDETIKYYLILIANMQS